jgi:hypothetical protein
MKQTVAALREENARLKGLKGRPTIKPSGMEQATAPSGTTSTRGKVSPRVSIENHVLTVPAPVGSHFKGYGTYLVQDDVLHPQHQRRGDDELGLPPWEWRVR